MLSPIKWSGSKRYLAEEIISYFPLQCNTYFEPFLGSGAILLKYLPNKSSVGDIYDPLIKLWKNIQCNPNWLYDEYVKRYNKFQEDTNFYYEIRSKYNSNFDPEDLFFLTRTCYNGLIRFNKEGNFSTSCHFGRSGMKPERVEKLLLKTSLLLSKVCIMCEDYEEAIKRISTNDFMYLDPPYFKSKGTYFGNFDESRLFYNLEKLNSKNIKWCLSYDGKTNIDDNVRLIPSYLYKRHIALKSKPSSFRKLKNKKNTMVQESLYLNY